MRGAQLRCGRRYGCGSVVDGTVGGISVVVVDEVVDVPMEVVVVESAGGVVVVVVAGASVVSVDGGTVVVVSSGLRTFPEKLPASWNVPTSVSPRSELIVLRQMVAGNVPPNTTFAVDALHEPRCRLARRVLVADPHDVV